MAKAHLFHERVQATQCLALGAGSSFTPKLALEVVFEYPPTGGREAAVWGLHGADLIPAKPLLRDLQRAYEVADTPGCKPMVTIRSGGSADV
jgi:hypothetical protein